MNAFKGLENSFQKSKKLIVPNVGIGTTTPNAQLHLSSTDAGGAQNITRLRFARDAYGSNGDTDYIDWTSGLTGTIGRISLGRTANGESGMGFWTYGSSSLTEQVRIGATGNVGIGTTSPSSKLHLVSSVSTAGSQILQDYTTASALGTSVAHQINIIDNNTNGATTSYGLYVNNTTGTNNVANRVGVYAESYNSSGPNPVGVLAFRDVAAGYSYGVYAQGGTSSVRAVNQNHALSGTYTGTNGGGDALWLDSTSITSDNLANMWHRTSNFSGTGLMMDFADGTGTFTGKYVDFLNNNVSVFSVNSSGDLSSTGMISMSGRTPAPGVAAVGQGRIYFDTASNKFKVSEHGGAYTDLVGGSGGGLSGLTTNGVLFATGTTTASTDNSTFSWNPSNKRLGIGTSTPRYTVDIVKSDAGADLLNLQNTAANGYADVIFSDPSGNERAAIGYANSGVGETHLQDRAFLTLFSRDFVIANGNPEVLMMVKNSGNVGIGTDTPNYKLDVVGDVNVTGSFRVNGTPISTGGAGPTLSGITNIANASGDITLAPAAGTGAVQINSGTASTSPTTGALIVSGGVGVSGGIYSGGAISAGSSVYAVTSMFTPQIYGTSTPSGNILIDGTSNATKGNVLLATAGGRVGIGTTTPTGPFHVEGGTASATGNGAPITITGQNALGPGSNDGGDIVLTVGDRTGAGSRGRIQLNGTTYIPDFLSVENGSGYPSYSGSSTTEAYPFGVLALGQNQPEDSSFISFRARNSAPDEQYAYIGIVPNNGISSPTFVIGRQTGATAYSESMRIDQNGNVGIGTTSPAAKLSVAGTTQFNGNVRQVAGQFSGASYNNAAGTSFDFNNGNVQYTSASCQAMTLSNMQDGGSYTIAVKGTTSGTCSFSHAGLTFHYSPAQGTTVNGSHSTYTFLRVGNDVYVTWIALYQ